MKLIIFGKKWIKENVIIVLFTTISIISIVASVIYVKLNKCETCEKCNSNTIVFDNDEKENIKKEDNKLKLFKIDIKGAVNNPGVYEVNENNTVGDAIYLAGGTRWDAVTYNINLSKKVKEEMVIYVFTQNEIDNKSTKNEIICEIPKCECEEVISYKEICANPTETITTDEEEKTNDKTSAKISINTNSVEELTKLEGIGESKAKQIIEYRKENGDFKNIEDIKNVSGIGDKAYEKIKNNIRV